MHAKQNPGRLGRFWPRSLLGFALLHTPYSIATCVGAASLQGFILDAICTKCLGLRETLRFLLDILFLLLRWNENYADMPRNSLGERC
jgi:hypothetical protein